jgi:hypothetical protein
MKSIVSPFADTVLINDTIWFSVSSPSSLLDLITNVTIDFSNAENMGTAFQFLELTDLNNGVAEAAQFFEYKVVKGAFTGSINSTRDKQFNFGETFSKYELLVGFIPKKKGIFSMAISNAVNVIKKSSSNCAKGNINIIIDNTVNQHLYLYQNNRPGYEISLYERSHLYCFKVN